MASKIILTTERLIIRELDESMAADISAHSQDEDNRRFVPDEVFETEAEALEIIRFLMRCYGGSEGPFVYAVFLKDTGAHIGTIEAPPLVEGFEIGYHIDKAYTRRGYAAEAVRAFAPYIMEQLGLDHLFGICCAENTASRHVMERCGFKLQFEGVGPYQGVQRPICRYLLEREA